MLKNKFGKIAIAIVLLSIVFLLGFKSENYFEISKNLDIFSSLYKEVNTYYVDDVNPSKFMRKGIDAMLESLDPYTNYISEDEIEGYRFQTTGKYGGIGATVRKAGDYVVIAEPYEKFAADKAGLQAGDMILEVDGKSVKGKSTDDISKILKGQPGTDSGMLNNGIAYVRLTQFTDQCGKEVENALKELKSKNEVKGIVLDLRGNPGGLLNEAVNLSNVFVDKGEKIVSTKGKVDEWDKDYLALNAPFDLSLPLVVLVNSGSASASEIVSGAIQDLDRGVIMGQKTFGKGLVQTTRGLSYGTQVKVTTAHYYTPSGRCIQALDYAHRNDDGSVGKIADSLKKSFKTSIGRIVYDGGGVDPDFKLDAEKPSSITQSLFEKNLIFDFACEYFIRNDKIDSASDFKLTYNDYEDFLTFIRSKDFDYVTKSEEALKNFETTAEKEEYYAALKTDLIALKDKMAHDKEKDLNKHKDEIVKFLTQEIVSRYYYQTGRVVSSLYNDNEVNKAVELLSNIEEYNKLLKL